MPLSASETTLSHLRHGVKTGLACVSSYVLSQAIGLPHGFWAAISAVIVMQVNVADSIRMCWYRFTGTAVGAVIGVVAILLFPETHVWTMVGLFLTAMFCAYMTRYNERYRMAAITVVIVFLGSLDVAGGEGARMAFALDRVLEIAIGVGSAFAVSLLLWPVHASRTLRDRLAAQYDTLADLIEAAIEAFLSQQSKIDEAPIENLAEQASQNRGMFNKALKHERVFMHRDVDRLSRRVSLLNRACSRLQAMLRILNEVDEAGWDIIMAPELRELAQSSALNLRAMATGGATDAPRLREAIAQVEIRLQELRDVGATKRFNLRKMLQVMGFMNESKLLAQNILLGVETTT